jgi:predicted MFS family arabinose efflux permease
MNHELKDGFTELWNNPNIFYLVKVVSVIMFAGGAIFVAFPIFVHHHYGVMAHGLAILISSLGGGLFLGAVSIARSSKILDHKVLFSWSITIVAILFYVFVMVKSFILATALMFLIGLFGAPIAICTETMIQAFVDDHKIGRVYSAMEMVIHMVFLIAMTLAGYLGKIWDVGVILMSSVIVSALLFAIVWQKERRRDLRV